MQGMVRMSNPPASWRGSSSPSPACPQCNFSHCILLIPNQKGGKGKKGKKKGDDGEDGVVFKPEEREARAKLRIEALERELVQRQDTVNRALQAHNDVRQRQSELLKDFEVNELSHWQRAYLRE
jgi:hypothetical protein